MVGGNPAVAAAWFADMQYGSGDPRDWGFKIARETCEFRVDRVREHCEVDRLSGFFLNRQLIKPKTLLK